MSVSLAKLRTHHSEILALVDEQLHFDVEDFCRVLGQRLDRHVVLIPFDPADVDPDAGLSEAPGTGGCSPFTGFYSRVEDPRRPGVIRDVVGYACHESIPRQVQEGYIFHELGHLVQHHAAGVNHESEKERLARAVAPTLWEYGGPEAIRHIMGRSSYRSDEEDAAEGFAVLLRERLATRPRHGVGRGGGLANRMARPLLDPFRGRGA